MRKPDLEYRRFILPFSVLIFAVCLLAACSGKEKIDPDVVRTSGDVIVMEDIAAEETQSVGIVLRESEDDGPEETSEAEDREIADGMVTSYLTGLLVPDYQGTRRPIAVMMSNDREALPQYGINRAGVVYEAPVEGGINRYMALIENYDGLERIGSCRSTRTYYTYFAKEWDAILVHYGQSTFAEPYLDNVDNINGLQGAGTGAFYRSSDKKSPHNAYTSADLIEECIEKAGYDPYYDDDYEGHFQFADIDDQYIPSQGLAYKVKPGYAINAPWFEYQPDSGTYHRFQYGEHHYGDEGLITCKNIIFQYCPIGYYSTTEYLDINVHADDQYGYYFTNGHYETITWKKDGEFGVTHYYDMDGNEIKLNPGKTWICIIDGKDFNKAEIYGN